MSRSSLGRPVSGWKLWFNQKIRHAIGLSEDPPPICTDLNISYMDPSSIARLVHGDLGPMLVGGIASLLLEMLHPRAMAGVADHSRFKNDPFGRMLQTANFIGFTTYGSRNTALAAIERVRAVHEAVTGFDDLGNPYAADDPDLLLWIHCAEISMFLEGFLRYGHDQLRSGEKDAYVNDMAPLARDLQANSPPTSHDELWTALNEFRPALRLSPAGIDARDWLLHHVVSSRLQRPVFWIISRASLDLLPEWAQEMLGLKQPELRSRLVIRPLTKIFVRLVRVVVPPTTR
jgi:uncharacterized protein (DUF2236 family)